MEDNNISNITGDDNKVIQGLTAGGDIIIKIADDLPPEVKKEKQNLSNKIEKLVSQLTELKETSERPASKIVDNEKPNSETYQKIKWRRLVQAIKHQGCVLFIGPEISVDSKGNSLHQQFYNRLTEDYDEIEYHEKEGFFSPGADKEIRYDLLDFYKDEFQKHNQIGHSILEKFAQIPFSLIISLCPDDTMHHVFNDFDLKHQYLYFDGTRKEIDMPDQDNPIIYNILGSASENGRYIFTHKNLFNYLNDISIPSEIKKKIHDATHFLFIGFDFNKWYNRLLLFVLEFGQKQNGSQSFNIDNNTIAEEFEKFIEKQFNISSVQDDYLEFVGSLITYAREEEGLVKDLSKNFIQSNFGLLQKLSTKVTDEIKLEGLLKISETTDAIDKKIESFKQLIS